MPESFPCEHFESQAVLYAAGELDDAERAAVEAHARECAACAALLENEIKLQDAVVANEAGERIDLSGLLLARCRSELGENAGGCGEALGAIRVAGRCCRPRAGRRRSARL
jgi:hypothetical protein